MLIMAVRSGERNKRLYYAPLPRSMVTSFIIMDDIYPGKGGIPFTWKIIVGRGRSLFELIGYLIPIPDYTDRI